MTTISPHQSAPFPDVQFEKYALDNGLEVILREDHRLPIVAVNLWYHVGPANEKPGRTGFAHLFEHMMFQGSKHVPENQIKILEAAGGTAINGTTGFDRTNYFETMPSDRLELALWLESDRMAFLLDSLTARNLANQRDVVRNERRQRENSPYELANEELYRQLFPPGHPYRASIIGSHEDIESVSLHDVREFCRQYYVPNNASLALVGDFRPDEARRLVETYFGSIPPGAPVKKPEARVPVFISPKRVTVTDRVELPCIYKAWVAPPAFQSGDAEGDALSGILGGGTSSRLYQRLVHRGQIAQEVSVGHQSMAFGSPFVIRAVARPGVAPEALEQALDQELSSIQNDGPSDEEFERVRNSIEAGFVWNLEQAGGMGGVADHLNSYNHYLGDPGYFARDIERFRILSPADIRTFARTLTASSSVTVLCVPGEKVVFDAPKRVDLETDETNTSALNEDWRREVPRSQTRPRPEVPSPASFVLPNGLHVLFVEQHHIPAVTVSVVILGGAGSNPPTLPGLASFTHAMLLRGTSSRSQLQIAEEWGRLGVRWGFGSHADASVATIHVLKKNLEPALEIFSDVLLHASFDDEEIERVRRQRLINLARLPENPGLLATQALLRELYGAPHPYGFLDIGTEASNRQIRRDDLLQFHASRYVSQNAAVVVAGDLTLEDARRLAQRHFGAKTSGSAAPPPSSTQGRAERSLILIDQPGAPQTHLMLGQIGVTRSNPDYVAIELMNLILGGMFASRINSNLREKRGFTYGARSQFAYRRSAGPFSITAAVRTDATAAAIGEVFREIEAMCDDLVSEEELATAVESLRQSLSSRFNTLAGSAASAGELFVYELDLLSMAHSNDLLSAMTPADIQKAARQYLSPESMIVVAVGNGTKIEKDVHGLGIGSRPPQVQL